MSTITERLEAATSAHEEAAQRMHDLLDALDAQWITENLTIKVGSDPTDDYETIPAAMAALATKPIAEGATVTFALRDEQHVYDGEDIVIDHPFGSRIRLVGAAMLGADPEFDDFAVTGHDATARGNDAVTNLAMLRGKFASELRLLNGARLVVIGGGLGLMDDVLITGDGTDAYGMVVDGARCIVGCLGLHGFGNDNFAAFDGAEIGVTGTICSCASTLDGIELVASSIYRHPGRDGLSGAGDIGASLIGVGNGLVGVDFQREAHGVVTSIYAAGNAGTGHVVAQSSTSIVTVGAASELYLCGNGIHGASVAQQSLLDVRAAVQTLSANVSVGLDAREGGVALMLSGALTIANNGLHGCFALRWSEVYLGDAVVNANGSNGLQAQDGGWIRQDGGAITNNAGSPASANRGSYMFFNGSPTISGNGAAMSPAANTVGNHNSYIAT